MAHDMTEAEWRAFVSEGTRTAKLAVTRRDGSPHVVPVWIVLDGDDVAFTTAADTIKGKAIRRDGRVSICVDDDRPPYAFVRIDGTARWNEDAAERLRLATAIGGRYMGPQRAEEFGRRNAVPGELLVRVTPERVVARSGVTD